MTLWATTLFFVFGRNPIFQCKLQPLHEEELDPEATAEWLQIILDEYLQGLHTPHLQAGDVPSNE